MCFFYFDAESREQIIKYHIISQLNSHRYFIPEFVQWVLPIEKNALNEYVLESIEDKIKVDVSPQLTVLTSLLIYE